MNTLIFLPEAKYIVTVTENFGQIFIFTSKHCLITTTFGMFKQIF